MKTASAVVVSALGPEHVMPVLRLLIKSGWSGGAVPSPALIQAAGAQRCAFVATVESYPDPVGMVRVLTDETCVTYVAELVVDAACRGRGIGRALLDAVQAAYPSARIDLLSSEMATGFYEKTDFGPKPGYRRWPA